MWKYLRVRGEESPLIGTLHQVLEIPPRARRRVLLSLDAAQSIGNTSACAEKSSELPIWNFIHRKYLRVRGEEVLYPR